MRTPTKPEAVLVTAHRRPDRLDELLSLLCTGERTVYVSIDGSRHDVGHLDRSIGETRMVARKWQSRFPSLNIREVKESSGLRAAVVSAVGWALGTESRLIVLEDDIRPSRRFFEFCDSALFHYETDPLVGSITGYSDVPTSALTEPKRRDRLSCFTSSWGWATWRDRWLQASRYTPAITGLNIPQHIAQPQSRIYWSTVAYLLKARRIDSWAYPWLFFHWRMGWKCLTPQTSLVLNQGADSAATHTYRLPAVPSTATFHQAQSTSAPVHDALLDEAADKWSNTYHHKAHVDTAVRLALKTLAKNRSAASRGMRP